MAYRDIVLADSPVAYWKFDETSGTNANDEVSTNDGTLVGSVTPGVAGIKATAFQYDGIDGSVVVGTAPIIIGEISAEAWIKTSDTAHTLQPIFGFYGENSPYPGWGMFYNVSGNKLHYWAATGAWVDSTGTITDTNWHHVAVTVTSAGAVTFYIDGQPAGTASSAGASSNSGTKRIGAATDSANAYFFEGLIDEPAVYDLVLTATQIEAHYDAGIAVSAADTSVVSATETATVATLVAISAVDTTSVVSATETATLTLSEPLGPITSGENPLVTLAHTDTITVSLVCRRRWSLPSSGQVGEASFVIPHDSIAANTAYVNPDGGSFVHIAPVDDSGAWSGIVTNLNADEYGTTITASQPTIILSHIPVALNRNFSDIPAYEIARMALQYAANASGTYPLALGTVAAGLPLIRTYSMHGESCWSVLTDLMTISGQEVTVTVSDRQGQTDMLNWGGIHNPVYDGILMAPGQLRDATYGIDILEQRSRVTAISNYTSYSVSAPDVAANSNWPAHEVITADRPSDVKNIAEAEITRRLTPQIVITGGVPRDYWSLREGDYLRVLIPWARFSGATTLTRIISREIDEQGEVMRLDLQTESGQLSTNRVLNDIRQIQRTLQRVG